MLQVKRTKERKEGPTEGKKKEKTKEQKNK